MKKYEHGGQVWDGNARKWLDFSANINCFGCSHKIKRALRAAISLVEYYPDPLMKVPLKELSEYLDVGAENILPTSGGIDALNFIVSMIKPNRLIIPTPAFVEYEHIGNINSIPALFFPILNERRYLYIDIDLLNTKVQENDMLIVCNPVNPIGHAMGKETIESIMQIAEAKNAYVLIDEAFIEYCPSYSSKTMLNNYKIIIAGSLTKMFAIPGVRLGYILANKELIKFFRQSQMPWEISCFAASVCKVLNKLDGYVNKSLIRNEINREKFSKQLEDLGFYVFDSKANFLLADIKDTGITASYLAEELKKRNILIRDCSNYKDLDQYYIRLCVKNKEENHKLVKTIKNILKELK